MTSSTASTNPTRHGADGTNTGDFDPGDWTLLFTISAIWGSSFLWIAIGLDSLHPGTIAWLRMVLGGGVLLAFFPQSRVRIPRRWWLAMGVIAVAGNAAPAIFFPLAQQRIESSVAGMLNSVGPILVLVLSVLFFGQRPSSRQIVGLFVGLAGAAMLAAPNLSGADAEPIGVLYVVAAIVGYATSNNFLPRIVQTFNGPAVMGQAMVISSVILAPWGLYGVARSSFEWKPVIALFILGVFGTGIARAMFATLGGRIGAPRAAMVGYLVPVFAIVLGVTVRDESVGVIELIGTAVVLLGATLISRGRGD